MVQELLEQKMKVLGHRILIREEDGNTVITSRLFGKKFGCQFKTGDESYADVFREIAFTVREQTLKHIQKKDSDRTKGKYLLVPLTLEKQAITEKWNKIIIATVMLDKIMGQNEKPLFTNNISSLKLADPIYWRDGLRIVNKNTLVVG